MMNKNLRTKNTLETARILASEFVKLFGEKWGNENDIRNALVPRGKATTWGGLDRNINVFCKQFYTSWDTDSKKVEFLDNARFLIGSLPMKLNYTLNTDQEKYSSPKYISQFFETCSLCWRSVLRKPLERKTPLCHIHDLPSTHTIYRRLARTKPRVEEIRLKLIKSLPPLIHLKKELGAELNEYIKDLCLTESGALPQLSKYLHFLDMPLGTGQEIIQALESPIYQKVSSLVRQAWKYHLDDRGERLRLAYIQILTAEAWLSADCERKHGGRRK